MKKLTPEHWIAHKINTHKPSLTYGESVDFSLWKGNVKEKFNELLGEVPEPVDFKFAIEYEIQREEYKETKFWFTSEANVDVACVMLVPNHMKYEKIPLVVGLQGHSTGVHISLGIAKYDEKAYEIDQFLIDNGENYAIQAVKKGYAALVFDQRGMGERRDLMKEYDHYNPTCDYLGKIALFYGTTLIRLRIWDVQRALDCIAIEFPNIDTNKVGIVGNSGGGTVSYYAACLDDRIKVAMPSCSICTFDESIIPIDHCLCNYIPRLHQYFEISDMAALIAPRKLIISAGDEDEIFLVEGVKRSFSNIRKIYKKANVKDNCKLYIGHGKHQFFMKAWDLFFDEMDKI